MYLCVYLCKLCVCLCFYVSMCLLIYVSMYVYVFVCLPVEYCNVHMPIPKQMVLRKKTCVDLWQLDGFARALILASDVPIHQIRKLRGCMLAPLPWSSQEWAGRLWGKTHWENDMKTTKYQANLLIGVSHPNRSRGFKEILVALGSEGLALLPTTATFSYIYLNF